MTFIAALANHLWQSTAVWLLLWAMMPLLRHNSAAVRSRLWMAASLKFLFPFALLSWAASAIHRMQAAHKPLPAEAVSDAVRHAEAPFTQTIVPAWSPAYDAGATTPAHTWLVALACVWIAGMVWVTLPWLRQSLRMRRRITSAQPIGMLGNVRMVEIEAATEPAVFGCIRPVLMLPRGIEQRLSPEQMDAVFAHELCHVRRHDNLQSAMHMLVTALFWFHPAVWIIRTHMLRERELACDEAVLAEGGEPDLYAESLLRVCRWYLEASPQCTAGISGAELKDRVRRILAARPAASLGTGRKALLACFIAAMLGLPLGVGMLDAQQEIAPAPMQPAAQGTIPTAYDVISIRPHDPADQMMNMQARGATFDAMNVGLDQLFMNGYDVRPWQVYGKPSWADNKTWDIHAKLLNISPDDWKKLNVTKPQREQLVASMLVDRFKLQYHWETKELPVYDLVVDKNGPKFAQNAAEHADELKSVEATRMMFTGDATTRTVMASQTPIRSFLWLLSSNVNRDIIDKTGLTDNYTFELKYALQDAPPEQSNSAPSIFTAVQEQLGLKLVPSKGPVKVLVIDHIEQPTAN